MGRCKEIILRVIPAKLATPFVKAHHYSGKVVNNSSLHFGAFLDGALHGVMSFGPSMDKSKVLPLVEGTGWNECIELNRMAFDDYLPRNSESYCIGKALRMIKKQAPHIKWVISFADGCSCGDGTIYRAANFVLTQIKRNTTIYVTPWGEKIAKMTLEANWDSLTVKRLCEKYGVPQIRRNCHDWEKIGLHPLEGFMLRYIYFLDPAYRARLTVPVVPFSAISERGACMYKGRKPSDTSLPSPVGTTEVPKKVGAAGAIKESARALM